MPIGDTDLSGRDTRRRTVFALGDPMIGGPPGLPTLRLKARKAVRLRHQIALPAASVYRLMESLDSALADLPPAPPELVTGHPGARAWLLRDEGVVALVPEDDQVRVVVFTDAR